MSASVERKQSTQELVNEENNYNVEERDESGVDDFLRPKREFSKTSSILNAIVDQIHPDIIAKSHQSNFVLFPPKLEGCTVVDLGCGVGRDVFILSKLVGENGLVIGVDSEKDKLDFARQHVAYHMNKFGLKTPNVKFVQGDIDRLGEAPVADPNSVDVVVSNSVINYKRNKRAIIEGVYKLLKPGGEFYFSDVYVNRPIPAEYQELLSGEYIGGALQWEDLILFATAAGFSQPRLVTAKPIVIANEDILKVIGPAKFVSAIFRCFKLPSNDNDATQFYLPYQLTYETPLDSCEDEFFFDHLTQFKLGELLVVDDPSIALELSLSRYKDNFSFDPIDDSKTTAAIVETFEEAVSLHTSDGTYDEEFHLKTTRITTMSPNDEHK